MIKRFLITAVMLLVSLLSYGQEALREVIKERVTVLLSAEGDCMLQIYDPETLTYCYVAFEATKVTDFMVSLAWVEEVDSKEDSKESR